MGETVRAAMSAVEQRRQETMRWVLLPECPGTVVIHRDNAVSCTTNTCPRNLPRGTWFSLHASFTPCEAAGGAECPDCAFELLDVVFEHAGAPRSLGDGGFIQWLRGLGSGPYAGRRKTSISESSRSVIRRNSQPRSRRARTRASTAGRPSTSVLSRGTSVSP